MKMLRTDFSYGVSPKKKLTARTRLPLYNIIFYLNFWHTPSSVSTHKKRLDQFFVCYL